MMETRLEEYAQAQASLCLEHNLIPNTLYEEYGVNRGLRDANGAGVLAGLTRISNIVTYQEKDGRREPCEGQLYYRGCNIQDLVSSLGPRELGFERTAYLLLFGRMPTPAEEAEFRTILGSCRTLPTHFTRDVIMKAPSQDIMNSMTRSILTLATYDPQAQTPGLNTSLSQCIRLIAVFPMLAVYGYHAYNHYENGQSMYIHPPAPGLSTAENFLRMLHPDRSYTPLEAKALDLALILHMEHGGGNNSTFTTRLVTSAGSDTYAAMAAALSSLKGHRHGGANLKVIEMIRDLKAHVPNWTEPRAVENYLSRLVDGQAFDGAGLIYGMGHAVYSLSDPREQLLRRVTHQLALTKGREEDLSLYETIASLAPPLLAEKKNTKVISPNVDFYSGFLYELLGIPLELYTPLFATARIVGWSAHRLEELVGAGKIIRPAYMSVQK